MLGTAFDLNAKMKKLLTFAAPDASKVEAEAKAEGKKIEKKMQQSVETSRRSEFEESSRTSTFAELGITVQ